MKNTLGAHYQTWKNKSAVNNVLSNFRKYYPEAPIRMVSDAGDDFSDLANTYNCIFDYETENIYPRGILIGHPVWKKEISDYGAKIWLKRLYDTCIKLDTDWILFMEDDLLTIGTIKDFPETTSAGKDCSPYRNNLINFMVNSPFAVKEFCWYGYGLCGGGIFKREFMIEAYEKHIDKIDFNFIGELDDRILGWPDILINCFISMTGGTYSSGFKGTTEAFSHGDKSLYEELQGSTFHPNTELWKELIGN